MPYFSQTTYFSYLQEHKKNALKFYNLDFKCVQISGEVDKSPPPCVLYVNYYLFDSSLRTLRRIPTSSFDDSLLFPLGL